MSEPPRSVSSARSAAWVGLGIFLSRVAGLIRERVFAHYFGNLVAADAFRAAVRIPNLLQNLLGEGVLSASFIPVYARLRAEGREQTASQVASVVAALLALAVSVSVALGVAAAPWLVALLAPGFEGAKREATMRSPCPWVTQPRAWLLNTTLSSRCSSAWMAIPPPSISPAPYALLPAIWLPKIQA